MKITRLIFFSVFLFLIGFLVGNIKASYKNSDKESVALENMLKVQGEKPDSIKNTLDYMKAQKLNKLQDQLFSIAFGAFLGAVLSFVATELSASRQRKTRDIEKKKEITNEVINDTIRFVFKANDILNDLWADKEVFIKMQKEKPEKAFGHEQIMLKRFDENMKGLFSELMFYSFQLKKLDDRTLWQDFERLMESFRSLTTCLLNSGSIDDCRRLDIDYKDLKKRFVEKCINTAKT